MNKDACEQSLSDRLIDLLQGLKTMLFDLRKRPAVDDGDDAKRLAVDSDDEDVMESVDSSSDDVPMIKDDDDDSKKDDDDDDKENIDPTRIIGGDDSDYHHVSKDAAIGCLRKCDRHGGTGLESAQSFGPPGDHVLKDLSPPYHEVEKPRNLPPMFFRNADGMCMKIVDGKSVSVEQVVDSHGVNWPKMSGDVDSSTDKVMGTGCIGKNVCPPVSNNFETSFVVTPKYLGSVGSYLKGKDSEDESVVPLVQKEPEVMQDPEVLDELGSAKKEIVKEVDSVFTKNDCDDKKKIHLMKTRSYKKKRNAKTNDILFGRKKTVIVRKTT